MEDAGSVLLGFLFMALFFGWLYLMFRMIRGVFRRNRKRKEDFEIRKAVAEKKAAEYARSELREKELAAEVEASRTKAEAEERAMRAAEQKRKDAEATLEMSTVTYGGKTMTLKEAIEERTIGVIANNTEAARNSGVDSSQIKCSQCGASLGEGSRFCNFCGTKVPDNTFRAEVRFEDVAKIREAELEHERQGKLLYRLTEAKKAITKDHEVLVEQLKTKVEQAKIQAEERAKEREEKERERQRQREIEIEKARAASRKAMISMIKLWGIIIALVIIAAIIFGKK